MPELPEVETIKNQLNKKIKDKTIKSVEIKLPKMIQGVSPIFFKKTIEKTKIKEVGRRAKILIISLSNGYSLLIHLKLSGQLIYIPPKNFFLGKYTHLIYHFIDHSRLLHNDLRQFGYVKLAKTSDLETIFQKMKIGPEFLVKEFTFSKFRKNLLEKPNAIIKPLLMDQSFIAGIGNIYAQEICWQAKVLPDRKVNTLTELETKDIYQSMIRIIKSAIKNRGTTAGDDKYVDADGKRGLFSNKLKVYQREKKECFRCSVKIKKIKLANRGTYFCPGCQK